MEPRHNEGRSSPLTAKNTNKYEQYRGMSIKKEEPNVREETAQLESNLRERAAKRQFTDNQEEVTTPSNKRIKQERDDSSLFKKNLHDIVNEVAQSLELESNSCEISVLSSEKSSFEKANGPGLGQHDVIVLLDDADEQPDHAPRISANTGSPSLHPTERRKQTIPVSSTVNQQRVEARRPILRTLKSLESRESNGFAFDHICLPKLVEVHSLLSSSPATTSISTEKESHLDLPQKSELSAPFVKQSENITMKGPVNIQKISFKNTAASSSIDSNLLNSRFHSSLQKQYDLLFTFRQKDGQSDMFLVVDDEVFSVRRYEYKGDSYLIHTDSSGKTSVLAKFPEKVKAGSQKRGSVSGQGILNEQRENKNGLTSALQQQRNTSLQRLTLRHPTSAPVTITPVQTRRHLPASSVEKQSFQQISRVTRGNDSGVLPSMHECPAVTVTRKDTLNVEKRQYLQAAEQRQIDLDVNTTQSELPDQQCFHPISGAISQTTTADHNNVFSTLRGQHILQSNNVRNRQLVMKQNAVVMVEGTHRRHNSDIENNGSYQAYTQQVTNEGSDNRRYGYVTLSSEEKQRIIYRSKLMNYIAQRLASCDGQPSTNVSVGNRSDGGDASHISCRKIATESYIGRGQDDDQDQVTPNRQIFKTNTDLLEENTERKSKPTLVQSIKIHDDGQQMSVNQMAKPSCSLVNRQPRSDAQCQRTNRLHGRLRMNGAAHSNRILQTVDSWRGRRQQHISLKNNPLHVKNGLVGTPVGVTGITTPNTATSWTSTIRRVSRPKPVISQVSYGVISRSTVGENVAPNQSATALVIDPERSIYIDATDSVIEKELKSSTIGQRVSNEGPTVRQTRNYSTSNKHYSRDLSSINPRLSSFQSSMRQMPNQSILSVSKIGKRGATHNKLENIFRTMSSHNRTYCLPTHTGSHGNSIDPSQTNNAGTDDVVEITMNKTSEQVSQPETMVPSDSYGRHRYSVKRFSQSAADDPKQGDYDDGDVVEIIYETPKRVSKANVSETTHDSDVISKDVSCPQSCTKANESVEIANPTSKQCYLFPKVVEAENEAENEDKLVLKQQGYTGVSPLKRLLQTLPKGSSTTLTQHCNGPNRADAPEQKVTSEGELTKERNLKCKQDSDPSQIDDCEIVHNEKYHLEQYLYNQTELKNIQQRDELMKKIKSTQERMAQENIDWKRKYLHRLEVQLKKKLAKLRCITEQTKAYNDDD